MKFFLFVLYSVALLGNSYCEGLKKQVKMPPELVGLILRVAEKCQAETNIGVDALLLIYNGSYRNDEQFKNFLYCSYYNGGFLNKDGYVNVKKSKEAFNNEPLIVEGITRCAANQVNDKKESLFNYFKCFSDTVPIQFTM